MTHPLQLRSLQQADVSALLVLYRELHPNDEPLPEARAAELWQAIASDANQIYLGGFLGGELVAACNAAITPNLTRGGRPFAVIENVVVASAQRRRGFGTLLLRELVEQCWQRDCYKIMLQSAQNRAGAHDFYEAIGFDRAAKQAFVMKR